MPGRGQLPPSLGVPGPRLPSCQLWPRVSSWRSQLPQHPRQTELVLQVGGSTLCTIYYLLPSSQFLFAFSFLRSKQRQSNSQRDSPRRSAAIDNYSSLNNSLHEAASASTTQSQPSSQSNGQASHEAKDVTDNAIVDASPPLAMTQSTLDTLNSMTTENIKDERNDLDNSKGE